MCVVLCVDGCKFIILAEVYCKKRMFLGTVHLSVGNDYHQVGVVLLKQISSCVGALFSAYLQTLLGNVWQRR